MQKHNPASIPSLATTGIGSLPYDDPKTTLACALATDIPFYPTLPNRHASEGMLAQAIQDFPGMALGSASPLKFDAKLWQQEKDDFIEKLSEDFNRNRYSDWLPNASESLWPAFLSNLTAHAPAWVKTQMTGPLTLLQAMDGFEEQSLALQKELLDTLSDFLTAKALAMNNELRFRQKQTLLFIDEPGLCTWDQNSLLENLAFEKLGILLQELKSYGIKLGLHCCGNTDFAKLLELPLDYLSIDALLSLDELCKNREMLENWLQNGGRLCLGLVPTRQSQDWNPVQIAEGLKMTFHKIFPQAPSQAEQILAESLLSPACGLALTPVREVKWVFESLNLVQSELKRMLHE